MTEEIVYKAQELMARNKRCNSYMNDLRMSDITYKSNTVYFECKGTSIEVPIPDELRQSISDMLYSYYRRLANESQREFDILGTRQGDCEKQVKYKD